MDLTTKPKTRTEQILSVLHILAWIAFIGYAIEAGAVLVSFAVSCVNPEAAKNLYLKLDFRHLRQFNMLYYSGSVLFMIVLSVMKSYVWFLVIKTLQKINLVSPFTKEVANMLERISYLLFSIWLIGMLSNGYTASLFKLTGELFGTYITGEFVFMAGLIFVISQIFKRGVEIQSENELTV
jgi:hypothetical protein